MSRIPGRTKVAGTSLTERFVAESHTFTTSVDCDRSSGNAAHSIRLDQLHALASVATTVIDRAILDRSRYTPEKKTARQRAKISQLASPIPAIIQRFDQVLTVLHTHS